MAPRYAVPLAEVGLDDVAVVGGKSGHLGDLLQAGFPVPPGFAVTTEAQGGDGVEEELARAYAELGRAVGVDDPPVAVRSSAIAEDLPDASFAGVQDTYLWIRGAAAVTEAVRRCWASFHNPEAVAYRREHGITRGGMGVAVQQMVDARVAGVMFTLNPLTGDPSSVAVEASYGLGSAVVAGEVNPDSFVLSKVTGEVRQQTLGAKALECVPDEASGGTVMQPVEEERRARWALDDEELARLVDLARRVERHYGRHQDLEWAIDGRLGSISLLQARPETVWSQKPKEGSPSTDTISAIAATFLPKR